MNSVLKTFATSAALLCVSACSPQPATPADPDMVRPKFSQEMQSTLTAYFKTHSLDKSAPLAPGLTIPWISRKHSGIWGFLVADGTVSKAGCPVFDEYTVTVVNGGYTTPWKPQRLAICP